MSSLKTKKLLFIMRHAPYGNTLAKESIDAVLATSAYDQELSVVFIDDGVFQLMDQQKADAIQQKSISNILSAFALYDIQSLFVCQKSLQERGIETKDLYDDITLLDNHELQQLLHQQDHLLSF